MTLTGPAGVGASRLARDFAREHGGVVVLDDARGRDLPEGPAIATAREPLGVPGERVYPLRPLAEAPAVELYREHAPALAASYAELARRVRALGFLPAAIVRAAEEAARQ